MNLTPLYLYLLTLNDHQKAKVLSDQLYNNILVGDFDNAITMSLIMDKSNGTIISDVVAKLFENNVKNTIDFAYKLWSCGGREVVINHFPENFRMIFNDDPVKIINKKYELALKLTMPFDETSSHRAWGDASDTSSKRVSWKFEPIWDGDRVYFRIINDDYHQYLALLKEESVGGHREAWGTDNAHTDRHQWYMRPVKKGDEHLFYIFNRQYDQGLKLDDTYDEEGDRILWGHNGSVNSTVDFGWYILPL